jgi:alanine-synthesizing transaminase
MERKMDSEFYRIKRLPPYVFAEVNAMKAKARAAGEDITDLGMGNPNLMPPQHVMDKVTETMKDPKAHRYSVSKGIHGLRKAMVDYYERRFNVSLDPNNEVIATLGSKEGLANLAQAITASDDVILVPNPSYPIHHFGFIIAGATMRYLPTTEDEDFMHIVEKAFKHSIPKPLALVLNFPSNPTAQIVDYGAFTPIQVAAAAALNGPQDCIDFARNTYKARRDVLVTGMAGSGWEIPSPEATMFAWVPLPEGWEKVGSNEFSKSLLEHAKVAVAPGKGFGEYGDGFVGIALVENEQRIRQAIRNMKQFLKNSDQYLNQIKEKKQGNIE